MLTTRTGRVIRVVLQAPRDRGLSPAAIGVSCGVSRSRRGACRTS